MPPFVKSFGLGLFVNATIILIALSYHKGPGGVGIWFFIFLLAVAFIIFLIVPRKQASNKKENISILLGVLLAIPFAIYILIVVAPFIDLLLGKTR